MDYEKLHKNTIVKLQEMVNSGKITVEIARGICADFVPESEDEIIIKALKSGFKMLEMEYNLKGLGGIKFEKILSWLEKQGENDRNMKFVTDDAYQRGYDEGIKVTLEKKCEQKPVPDWMPKFLDELRSKKNYFDWDEDKDIEGGILAIINWMNPNYFNEKDDEQKPQGKSALEAAKEEKVDNQNCVKPADKVEPKFKVGDRVRYKGRKCDGVITEITDTDYICGNAKLPISTQNNLEIAWSEEDETKLTTAQTFIRNTALIGNDGIKNATIDWLKSLKDKVGREVNCTTTKEWSEEDKNHVKSILSTIECCKAEFPNAQAVVEAYNADIEWLKSLRPQSQWKPSEEMLEALYRAIPENVMEISEDEMLLDKLYQGLKYGRVLSNK